MKLFIFLSTAFTATIFLQAVPAPTIFVWFPVAGNLVLGTSIGITAAGLKDREKREKKVKEDQERQRKASQRRSLIHVRKIAREVAAELGGREGPGSAPPGVPQHNWNDCYHAALESEIFVEGPTRERGIRATNVPPVCMVLANVLGGIYNGTQPTPIPCGSDCMDWINMTPEYYDGIRSILNSKPLNLRHKRG
ncbi:uncharacterized protein CTRU02_207129 [Colletotrichum truncatum]|uniref:Uncharacterized protein n=1 Tax=Colletotrichum truncatum TaxID=5467 RepID=A0ACC3Z004_COLTU|nr:uncharacterized protein CTRU02_01243 [Colletotrichum truncatum]KAF6800838.1 hypothetical protein CTRU02_01243 [Colletotrichum truncatum]